MSVATSPCIVAHRTRSGGTGCQLLDSVTKPTHETGLRRSRTARCVESPANPTRHHGTSLAISPVSPSFLHTRRPGRGNTIGSSRFWRPQRISLRVVVRPGGHTGCWNDRASWRVNTLPALTTARLGAHTACEESDFATPVTVERTARGAVGMGR